MQTITKKLRVVKETLHQVQGILEGLLIIAGIIYALGVTLAPGVVASSEPVDGAAPYPTAQHVTVDVYFDADSCARPAP